MSNKQDQTGCGLGCLLILLIPVCIALSPFILVLFNTISDHIVLVSISFAILFGSYIYYQSIKQKIIKESETLKKRAKAKGAIYDHPQYSGEDFKIFMQYFFKGKRHEWVFVAFCVNNRVIKYSLNKGDSISAPFFLNLEDTIKVCAETRCTSIIIAHNHPYGPNRPSKDDLHSLYQWTQICNQLGIKLEHHIYGQNALRQFGLTLWQRMKLIFCKIS